MHSGCCLTIVGKGLGVLRLMLRRTPSAWLPGSAWVRWSTLKIADLADKLGGHLVTGHVDATGLVTKWQNLAESWLLEVEVCWRIWASSSRRKAPSRSTGQPDG